MTLTSLDRSPRATASGSSPGAGRFHHHAGRRAWGIGLAALALLPACGDSGGSSSDLGGATDTVGGASGAATSNPEATTDGAGSSGPTSGTSGGPDATTGGSATGGGEGEPYRATIRRDTWGIAHIVADDFGSLGFGQGYAMAEDRYCLLMDMIVKIRGERARYLGPGEDDVHINSDFAYRHLDLISAAAAEFGNRPAETQAMMRGYAAGVNHYLEQTGAAAVPGYCQGAEWLGPIEPEELYAYYLDLAINASGKQLIQAIGTALPPGAGGRREGIDPRSLLRRPEELGSNGWAIGSELSESGRGMLVINPHFPWDGELQLWESQLTIPGEFNVYGAGLTGVIGVLLGFNDAIAGMHTVSAGTRFTGYKLSLVPGNPTSYLYDGEPEAMTSGTYVIEVRQPDGTVAQAERTLYRSRYGPIINVRVLGAPFGWAADVALSYRDTNIDNYVLVDHFFAKYRAQNMDEYQAVHRTVGGNPWTNTISASAEGRAWYTDSTPVPNLSQAAIDAWLEARSGTDFIVRSLWEQAGLVVLDGSNSRDEWIVEPGARSPGLVPLDRLPALERTDYVFNANDSYWLSHAEVTIDGDYSPLFGSARTPRSARTRMNAFILSEPNGLAGADGKWSLEELRDAAVSNRGSLAELLKDEVVARCGGAAPITVSFGGAPQTVDVTAACGVLAAWDGRSNLDSVGAALWREFLDQYDSAAKVDAGPLFAEPWSVDDPIATPRGLTPAPPSGDDPVVRNLALAQLTLESAGVAIDAPLGEVQFTKKGAEIIPIHGGPGGDGVTNVLGYSVFQSALVEPVPRGTVVNGSTDLTDEGYVINNGTSYIAAIEFAADGPRCSAFLTYSQSSDPSSPHYADQTRLFSEKAWRPCLYREEDVLADPNLREYEVTNAEFGR
jgi:acyl-homoserine-lactone acylase